MANVSETSAWVFDNWALVAYLRGEPAGGQVAGMLRKVRSGERDGWVSLINYGELYYILARRKGEHFAEGLLGVLRSIPVQVLPVTEGRVLQAARIKAVHPISYADAFAVAAAQELDAVLVTGDPEIVSLRDIVRLEIVGGP